MREREGAGGLFIVETSGPDETRAWGRRLGELAGPGDFFALTGDIGAGKTVFAQGVLEGLGVTGYTGSPTFTIVHEYDGRLPAYHLDLYRLGPDAAREDLGFGEMFHGRGVAVVEWAEAVRALWPEEHIEVHLSRLAGSPTETRRITFTGRGARGRRLEARLAARAGETRPC